MLLHYVVAALIGLGVVIVTSFAIYLGWLKPMWLDAIKRREEAEATERRAQQETEARRDAVLAEAKEEASRIRARAEEEAKEKLSALGRTEDRLCMKEEGLEERRRLLEERDANLHREARILGEKEDSIERRIRAIDEEFQRVGALNKTQARDLYLKRVEAEFKDIGQRRAKEVELAAIADAERRAKKIILDVMQRNVVDYVTEATLAVVELPSEDMKGRIIGREGRNIRAFEQVTGVDLIIDETPEAVVISCFDPVRRETARLALMNLMVDGRIHPGRIEELYEKATAEVTRTILDAGERAAERANVVGLPPKVIETMGRLRFRTSYAQNVLDHSVEVSRLAGSLAAELGLNTEVAKRAGLLHDIGKALGPEYEGPHALTGMEFLRGQSEKDAILHAVGAHHHEIEPESPEAILVILADTISAARPGARRENLENYLKRLNALEGLANSFPGVERSYAVQAGREIRLIVKPMEVDDMAAARLANEVAKRIEKDLEYPGQIKVTVIREMRVQQVAK
ncbi:ribonuclease Y [Fimbriimonas ginsengisoli]|uniref:Ribonuclease Y n=1 Tax=Fimbriimonas ginsengisoli Gsoil 348 TaxID=661478 RepID=A0A068NQ59_FIMGI|nr:ribonuclease Y [Fimbriimonas ginsengisoli]AIE84895.1 HDIG/KH domain-containing protein [Fimbriimonas ginsengisoli Gsoil 348]